MRRLASLVLPLLLAGCSIDTAGLGGDLEASDDSSTTFEESGADETSPLFDAESDSGTPADATMPDAEPETASDGTVADTTEEAAVDSSVDGSVDGSIEAATDTLVDDTLDAASDTTSSDALDDVTDAPEDTGPLGSTPGQTSCSHNGTAKLCTGQLCCGSWDTFSWSWKWDCSGGCFAGRDYACDEKADCPTGKICCAKTPPFSSNVTGSDCRSSCGSDPQLCMTDAECGGSKTCQPQKAPDSPHTIGICK